METTYNNFSKQPTSIPNAQENLFIADTTNDLGEIHPVSPPLSYQMRSPQVNIFLWSENSGLYFLFPQFIMRMYLAII